jgi:uncharacterized protein
VIGFEWDQSKNKINISKHGVDFQEVITIFEDPSLLTLYDENHSTLDIDRWISMGINRSGTLYLVVHINVIQDEKETIRIISARKPTRNEEKQYNDRRRNK